MTGFVNVYKEVGFGSAREVAVIKRLTGTPCGHMGTLDPMAEGVLPIAVGNACRLFDFFLSKAKTYLATFRFGEDYDTLDTTGTAIKTGGRTPTAEEIEDVIPELVGEVMQIPPKYSAKNVGGQRSYRLARQGVEFELKPKKVTISQIRLIERKGENEFSFEIECGGGTYIRSIARDMAEKLGTFAAMSALKRTASGPFKAESAVRTADLTAENIKDYIIPCDKLLPYESIYAEGATAKKLFNGVAVESNLADGIYKIYNQDKAFYGLATVEGGILRVGKKLC